MGTDVEIWRERRLSGGCLEAVWQALNDRIRPSAVGTLSVGRLSADRKK